MPPLSVALSEVGTLYAGEVKTVWCRARGSHPEPSFRWFLDNEKLDDHHVTTSTDDLDDVTTSVLTFTPSRFNNGAVLTCVAYSPNLPNLSKDSYASVSVQCKSIIFFESIWYTNFCLCHSSHVLTTNLTKQFLIKSIFHADAPIVKLILESHPENIWVKMGEDVRLRCSTESNPAIENVRWFYDGIPLDKERFVNITTLEDLLMIKNVSKEHTGSYSCEALNEIAISTSQVLFVEVKCKWNIFVIND